MRIYIIRLLLGVLLPTTIALGQATVKKTVILINGTPYLSEITSKGDVTAIYQPITEYFVSTESHHTIVERLARTAYPSSGRIGFFFKEEEPVPSFTEENKRSITKGTDQYIGFSPSRALLQKAGVDQIRKIAKSHRNRAIGAISITSFHLDTYRSRSLARHRMDAIRDLLEAFGVPQSEINTSIQMGNEDTKFDYVRLTF